MKLTKKIKKFGNSFHISVGKKEMQLLCGTVNPEKILAKLTLTKKKGKR